MSVLVTCPDHPRYMAQRSPGSDCACCWRVWDLVQSVRRWPRYRLQFFKKVLTCR